MVWEILKEVPNQYDLIIHNQLETWTVEKWRGAYGFAVGHKGFGSRTDKFIGGKF